MGLRMSKMPGIHATASPQPPGDASIAPGRGCRMRRRQFLALCGAALACGLAARAQQTDRVRRVGVLMSFAPGDPEGQRRVRAFEEALRAQGWTEGRNLQIEYRWAPGDAAEIRARAAEL